MSNPSTVCNQHPENMSAQADFKQHRDT